VKSNIFKFFLLRGFFSILVQLAIAGAAAAEPVINRGKC